MYSNVFIKYKQIEKDYCCKKYKYFIYGKSFLNQNLWGIKVGNAQGKKIIIQAGIHAREWITTFLLNKFFINKLSNTELNNLYYLIFCSNPDGLRIATCGIDGLDETLSNYLLYVNINSYDFALWKANARAVDLNVNFDAKWGKGKSNLKYFAPSNYIGYFPNSEIEVMSLINLTNAINPDLTISLHSKGEEVYFEFGQDKKNFMRDMKLANKIGNALGYKVRLIYGSVGGYKDWCIQKLKIPSLTIEVGNDCLKHPIDLSHLCEIYEKFKNIYDVLEKFS